MDRGGVGVGGRGVGEEEQKNKGGIEMTLMMRPVAPFKNARTCWLLPFVANLELLLPPSFDLESPVFPPPPPPPPPGFVAPERFETDASKALSFVLSVARSETSFKEDP